MTERKLESFFMREEATCFGQFGQFWESTTHNGGPVAGPHH